MKNEKLFWLSDDTQSECECCDTLEQMEVMIEEHLQNGAEIDNLTVIYGINVPITRKKVSLKFNKECY